MLNDRILLLRDIPSKPLSEVQLDALYVTVVSPLQPLNASLSISVTEIPIVTAVNPLQPSNELLPTLVTESGMFIEVSPLQPLNAHPLMLVTELPIVTAVNPLQPSNAQ